MKEPGDEVELRLAAPRTGSSRMTDGGALAFEHVSNDWHEITSEDEAFFMRVYGPGDYKFHGADLGILVTKGRMQTADGLTERCRRYITGIRAHYQSEPLPARLPSSPSPTSSRRRTGRQIQAHEPAAPAGTVARRLDHAPSADNSGFLPCVKLARTSMPPQMESSATASPRVLTIGHSNHTGALPELVEGARRPGGRGRAFPALLQVRHAVRSRGTEAFSPGRGDPLPLPRAGTGRAPQGDASFTTAKGTSCTTASRLPRFFKRDCRAWNAESANTRSPCFAPRKIRPRATGDCWWAGCSSIAEFTWSTFAATAGFKRKKKSPPKQTRTGIN